jgi:hypothetical protein
MTDDFAAHMRQQAAMMRASAREYAAIADRDSAWADAYAALADGDEAAFAAADARRVGHAAKVEAAREEWRRLRDGGPIAAPEPTGALVGGDS